MSASFSRVSRFISQRSAALPLACLALAMSLAAVCGCASGPHMQYVDPMTAGKRYYNSADYAQAAGAFRNVIRDNPLDYEAHYYLGVCYDRMNAYQEAMLSYKTGLDVRPLTYAGKEDEAMHLKLIDGLAITIAKCDARDSEMDALQAKARKTQSAWDYFLLAKISRYSSDADAALEQYNHSALLDNHNFPILKEYGLYLQQLNQSARARAVLWQAYALNQDDAQVATALRQDGVVPGPSLKDKSDLVQPVIPVGPIPPMAEIGRDLGINRGNTGGAAPATPATVDTTIPAASLQAPRE